MASKPKTPQKENLTEVDGRDTFQTPDYATEIIIPFLDRLNVNTVWECAAGLGKIARRLTEDGYDVIATDLAYEGSNKLNFLTDKMSVSFDAIVTNPPFSLKIRFYDRCREYGKPLALLVPAEYAIWVIDAVNDDGCEKIIPRRRVDYITPNILNRIHEGEVWENSREFFGGWKTPDGEPYKNLKHFKSDYPDVWEEELSKFPGYCLWESIYEAPKELLKKYSSSYYHSMWLTWGFDIGRTETFVELTNEQKLNI